MSDSDPYADFRDDDGPGSNLNIILNQLADELLEAEREVEIAEQILKEKKAYYDEIATKRIPDVAAGLEGKFNLGNNRSMEIKEEIRASVAGDKLPPAVEWLTKNKYDSIVKRTFVFEFGKDDAERVQAFKDKIEPIIKAGKLSMKEKTAVHPQTLLAWVKERLKEGDEIPESTFGVFRQKTAKVKVDD